uniref:Global nitrogen transcriptional regulator n=1 Tax=Melanthalia intermedia TaxID=172989 RepID=A0A345UAZ7_9FLOR|nr:global nitrogen transcriptional regulator [Melanthalia intermedia]AXI97633.1 global nitrogen transcriptional regulator [Melanthalia intermedia]
MKIKWIHLFLKSKIPFYVYKLSKGDSVILKRHEKHPLNIVVLYGTAYVLKIFTNNEALLLAIFSDDTIIDSATDYLDSNYAYSRFVALQQTYLLSFSWTDFISRSSNSPAFAVELVSLFRNTLRCYQISSSILAHKEIKNRVIQLLLFMCQEFAVIENVQFVIPFKMSRSTIGHMAGGNQVTVGKVMNYLAKKFLIKYTSKRKVSVQYLELLKYLYHHNPG